LIADGAQALISFGLAGGLDPALRPGALAIPRIVVTDGREHEAGPTLLARLRGPTIERLFGGSAIAAHPADKHRLWRDTGSAAIDLESGAVARAASAAGIPFAVLRAVCDPAGRRLPQAAMAALDQAGAIAGLRIARSVLRRPGQIPGLIALARDAAAARRALLRHVAAIGPAGGTVMGARSLHDSGTADTT
jgi:adenosylhomocysteine nucleosidase